MIGFLATALLFKDIKPGLEPRTLILTYHDIIPIRDSHAEWFDCTPGELAAQLDWLTAHHAHFITLDQLYRHLVDGNALPSHPVAITFADNYEGFYQRGFPIFKARHIPVAMFVHTAMVGMTNNRPKATWDQLKEMQSSGIFLACSQTVSHPADLRSLSAAQLDKEMSVSRRSLHDHLGGLISYLAYPNGKWDQESIAAARRAGYLMAFTEDCRPAENTSSILAVPRYVHTKYRRGWADAN